MDYEKKYKEMKARVLEMGRGYVKGLDYSKPRQIAEYIDPELKESEDEKIRKGIVKMIYDIAGGFPFEKHGIIKKEALAWLEKQGEHANFLSKIQVGDKVTRNKDGILVNLSQLNRVAKKLGEQKPVPKFKIGDTMRTLQEAKDGWTDGMPFVVSIDSEYYNCNSEKIAIKDQDEYEYPPMNRKHDICDSCDEQKPAWSEEDENLFRCAMDAVEQESKVRTDGCLDEEVGGMVTDWLKSLKDRVQPQPKQEWGDEDETYSDHVITAIKSYYTDDLGEENPWREKLLRWLKSLRPQSTWKLSDEQIKALWEVYKGGEEQAALASLYSDLKRLLKI